MRISFSVEASPSINSYVLEKKVVLCLYLYFHTIILLIINIWI